MIELLLIIFNSLTKISTHTHTLEHRLAATTPRKLDVKMLDDDEL